MKIVRIELDESTRKELSALRRHGSSSMRERSLAVLRCADGVRMARIAAELHRTPLTVRSWIHAFLSGGVKALVRGVPAGRPSVRKALFSPVVMRALQATPRDYGWGDTVWTVAVLIAQVEKATGRKCSVSTMERLLKDCEFSYKRPRKGVPENAPSKEEKLARVREIAAGISGLAGGDAGNVEVVFLDEAPLSTEPYVIRGWHRRGEPFSPQDGAPPGTGHGLWRIQAGNRLFLLEERSLQ